MTETEAGRQRPWRWRAQLVNIELNVSHACLGYTQDGTNAYDALKDCVVESDGSVYMVGNTQGEWAKAHSGDSDFAAVKLDEDGRELWRWQVSRMGEMLTRGSRTRPSLWTSGKRFRSLMPGLFRSPHRKGHQDSTGHLLRCRPKMALFSLPGALKKTGGRRASTAGVSSS